MGNGEWGMGNREWGVSRFFWERFLSDLKLVFSVTEAFVRQLLLNHDKNNGKAY